MNSDGAKELTREELYEKVWSLPAVQVAAELGISDVALAKRCKKLGVPKPSVGYWAKITAGQNPEKTPLPPTAAEVFIKAAEKSVDKSLVLPEASEPLHPLAAELMHALIAEKADSQKRVCIRYKPTLPEVSVTKAQIERVAKSFHVILKGVEFLDIFFRKARSSYDYGYFQRGHDRLYLKIEELVNQLNLPARRPNWQRLDNRNASGVLTFSIAPERYTVKDAKQWKESEKLPLEQLLAQIVTEIRRHYVAAQKRRAQEATEREKQRIEAEKRWREYQEKEAIRLTEEQKQKHAAALETTEHTRSEDLIKAAEWWRLHRMVMDFIQACEKRWRSGQQGNLTAEQDAWLGWACENAEAMSPFESSYPDAEKDGPFDQAVVHFGGPYPDKRDFPCPPTMPTIPPPVIQQGGYGHSYEPPPKQQFPFWLKYPRR